MQNNLLHKTTELPHPANKYVVSNASVKPALLKLEIEKEKNYLQNFIIWQKYLTYEIWKG